ncbi:unnamed protein product [Ceutorhynchus assimilis]|uniref:Zinc finger protein n=1 Tax=Ceutorhynchus assimilis TaxID=467358 RepID=A0A9N9QB39_9CUCU|nr:unnamed protein product [Ceutorhynchus assimilis]
MASIPEMSLMCRLCLAKDESQVNIPIFEDPGDIRQIFVKISSCLPIKISRDDELPKNICDGCGDKLELLYEFVNTSLDSEKTLTAWLKQVGIKNREQAISTVTQQISKPETLVKEESDNAEAATSYLAEESSINEEAEIIEEEEEVEPPKKRARRTAAVKAQISIAPESDDEDDNFDNTMDQPDDIDADVIAKLEEESEETDNDEKDPSYTDLPGTSAQDQPGTSGLGKDGAEAPNDLKSESPRIECSTCGQTFATKTQVDNHLRSLPIQVARKCLACGDTGKYCTHPIAMKTARCKFCDTNITEPYLLHRCFHFNAKISQPQKEVDSIEDKDICIYCNKTVPIKSLGKHESWHRKHDKSVIKLLNQKPPRVPANTEAALCSYCGKIKPNNQMRRHEYVQHIRKSVRKVCAVKVRLTFRKSRSLACHVCSQEFLTEKKLKRHLDTIAVDVSTSCLICKNLNCHHPAGFKTTSCNVCHQPISDFKNHLCFHRTKIKKLFEETDICIFCCKEVILSNLEEHENAHREEEKRKAKQQREAMEGQALCTTCGASVPFKDLKKHERTHRRLEPIMCTICGITAKNIYQHMATHSEERRFSCQECGLAFKYKKNLDVHMLVHESMGKHKCPTCSKAFKTPSKQEQCQVCHKTFHSKSLKKRHENNLEAFVSAYCKPCNSFFGLHESRFHHCSALFCMSCNDYLSDFRKHRCLHGHRLQKLANNRRMFCKSESQIVPCKSKSNQEHSNTNLQCIFCEIKFKRFDLLKKHIRIKHLEQLKIPPIPAENPCRFCQMSFKNKNWTISHERKQHASELIQCDICSESVKMAEAKSHYVSHRSHEKYKNAPQKMCNVCGVKIKNLETHMVRHDDNRKHQCGTCQKSFKLAWDLKRHMLVHTNETRHVCQICGKGFKVGYNLRVHMRSHQTIKPFACLICDKTFTTKQWRDNHLSSHR